MASDDDDVRDSPILQQPARESTSAHKASSVDDAISTLEKKEVIEEPDRKRTQAPQPSRYDDRWLHVTYDSVFGVFGTVLRIFMGRFFGLDCESAEQLHSYDEDFMARVTDNICITASGKTGQTGGALFTDLPANMLGSFVMGLLSPLSTGHPIVWFRPDHPLQHHTAFREALKVGFCGCLTTFASWNTQMIVMMVGTFTVLGPQVGAALFGYIIGTCCAVSCFFCGRHVYDVWRTIHPSAVSVPVPSESSDAAAVESEHAHAPVNNDNDHDVGGTDDDKPGPKKRPISFRGKVLDIICFFIGIKVMPFVVLAGLTAGFVVGDVVYGSLFYRKMWMSVILSPPGAILRWHLSKYNASLGPWKRLEFMPWGTLMANMIGVVISAICEALEIIYGGEGAPGYAWIVTMLPAIKSGFAGSLSSVSTFVREMVDMKTPTQGYVYGFGSLVTAMLLGLLFYAPIIRS